MSLDSSLGLTVLSKAKFLRLWTVRVKFYWCVPFVVAGHSQGQTWKGISSEPCRKPCQWHNQPPKAAASMHDVTIRSGLKAEAKCIWKIPPREKKFSKNLHKKKKKELCYFLWRSSSTQHVRLQVTNFAMSSHWKQSATHPFSFFTEEYFRANCSSPESLR